jgi:hypothetical protein
MDKIVSCLSDCADAAMQDVYDAQYVTLHVRVSNKAACHLYKDTLGYECGPFTDYGHILSLFPELRRSHEFRTTFGGLLHGVLIVNLVFTDIHHSSNCFEQQTRILTAYPFLDAVSVWNLIMKMVRARYVHTTTVWQPPGAHSVGATLTISATFFPLPLNLSVACKPAGQTMLPLAGPSGIDECTDILHCRDLSMQTLSG